MKLYYPIDVETAIKKIVDAGGDVTRKTHAMYVRSTASLTNDRYPLEIVVTDDLPSGTDILIAKKGAYSEQKTTPSNQHI